MTCEHSDLLDFDCEHPCPICREVGPHLYREEPYCEMCGKPHDGWYAAIKELVSR